MRWMLFVVFTCGLAGVMYCAAIGDDLPEGKGKEALQKMCGECHGLDRVTAEKNSKKTWANVVDDMVSRGAEGSDADIKAVVSYLSSNFGKPVNINSATAKEIEAGLSFSATEAEALVRYRTDKGAFKSYEDVLKVPGLDAELLAEQKKNILF